MATLDTGWLYVLDNEETQLVIPAGAITKVEVRWKGVERSVVETSTTSNSTSGSDADGGYQGVKSVLVPSKAGWTYVDTYGSASVSLGGSGGWDVSVQIAGSSWKSNSGTGTGGSVNDTKVQSPSYYVYGEYQSDPGIPFNWSLYGRASWRRTVDYDTVDPQITVDGNVTKHTGTLTDGQESSWIDCTTGFVVGSNTIRHDSLDSARAYVQILVTYDEPVTVTTRLPAQYSAMARNNVSFTIGVTAAAGSPTVYWPKITLSRADDMDPLTSTLDSSTDQTGWEYFDESTETWETMTSAGVPIAYVSRYTPATEPSLGRWWWQAQAIDDDLAVWGPVADIWQYRVALSLVSRFAIEIDETDFSAQAQAAVIVETTNGELGSMEFVLKMPSGEDPPGDGASVIISVRSAAGQEEFFEGWMRGAPERIGPQLFKAKCKLPDSILAERVVLENYTVQDIGLVIKDIIDTYCAPLVSTGINTSTGFSRPVTAFGRTALDICNEAREQYGLMFWVDSTTLIAYLVNPDDLGAPVLTLARGKVL